MTDQQIKDRIDAMSVEQKVGQLLVLDFTGYTVTPFLKKVIRDYNCAGLRVQSEVRVKEVYHSGALSDDFIKERSFREPTAGFKDLSFIEPAPRASAGEYANLLNEVKQLRLDQPDAIPLHIVLDQEGSGYENFICGSPFLFPNQMGMAATNDPELVYEAYRIFARQLVLTGYHWIHSPVLDVNTDPKNPEIGIRSFSDDPEKVITFGKAMLRAFREEGLITTGKHFPGRGESSIDAHIDLPVIEADENRMRDVHIRPFAELINAGLPSIMTAHTIYPSLDKERAPGTVSKNILTRILREELGFAGAITSDNMLMSGMIKNYEILEACIQSINAGATLLLPRAESPLIDELYAGLIDAVEKERISIETIDQALYYNLRVKDEYGLFKTGGHGKPEEADVIQRDADARAVELRCGREAIVLMRDNANILPLVSDARVLLVDQTGPTQLNVNNFYCHPGTLWEKMLAVNEGVSCVEIDGEATPDEQTIARVMRRVPEADVIVATNYEVHRGAKLNTELVKELARVGKPLIVITNSPFNVADEFETVLVTFADTHAACEGLAEIVFGRREATGVMPIAVSSSSHSS
ncbi:MAG: glycoside hydrolase family 3 protein [Spirochaetales bacterium]